MTTVLPSKKQRELLEYIAAFIKEQGYAPSYREVMRALNYKSVSTVATHINGLIQRGWLIKKDNSARSVEVIYYEDANPSDGDSAAKWLISQVDQLVDRYAANDDGRPTIDQLEALATTLGLLGLDAAKDNVLERLAAFAEPASGDRS